MILNTKFGFGASPAERRDRPMDGKCPAMPPFRHAACGGSRMPSASRQHHPARSGPLTCRDAGGGGAWVGYRAATGPLLFFIAGLLGARDDSCLTALRRGDDPNAIPLLPARHTDPLGSRF